MIIAKQKMEQFHFNYATIWNNDYSLKTLYIQIAISKFF